VGLTQYRVYVYAQGFKGVTCVLTGSCFCCNSVVAVVAVLVVGLNQYRVYVYAQGFKGVTCVLTGLQRVNPSSICSCSSSSSSTIK